MYINTYQTSEPHGVYNSDTVKLSWLDQFDFRGKENLEICLSKDTRAILESKETVVGNVHLTVTLSIKYSAKTKVQPKVPLYE